jgi:hypothetical protein
MRQRESTQQPERVMLPPVQSEPPPPMPPSQPRMDPLGAQLRHVNGAAKLPAAMPPPAIVAPYDQQLADLIAAAEAAEHDAVQAAQHWGRCQPPVGSVYQDAVAAERTALDQWLVGHDGQLPPMPDLDDPSPLLRHLVVIQAAAFVAALRAEYRADWVAVHARDAARKAKRLREALDAETDQLRDAIAERLETARDHGDHGAYQDAWRLAKQWTDAARLFGWLSNPAQPWRGAKTGRLPAELAYLEWQCHEPLYGKAPVAIPAQPPDGLTRDQLARWWPIVDRRSYFRGRR